jgi:diguanylate cyclase (GGDEF)-like protein
MFTAPNQSQLIIRTSCISTSLRLCEHIRHANIQFEGQTLEAATLSVGVAVSPENGTTSVEILKAADTALYRAKREGRDRVIVASQ